MPRFYIVPENAINNTHIPWYDYCAYYTNSRSFFNAINTTGYFIGKILITDGAARRVVTLPVESCRERSTILSALRCLRKSLRGV